MIFKKILTNGCVYYTVMITALYTVGLIASPDAPWIPTMNISYALLAFSLLFSALNQITKRLKWGFPAKLFLHMITSALLYWIIFVLLGGFHKNGGSTLAAMLVFVAVYALGLVVFAVYRYLFPSDKHPKASKDNSSEYKSIFEK